MGAKKWSTILKQNYDKTGRLWNNCSLEEEIKYYTDASFRNPNELIIWADSYHFTIKWFCFIYFRRFPDTNLSASIVEDMFFSRLEEIELYKFLSDEVILYLSVHIACGAELLERIKTNFGPNHEINRDTFSSMLWLHSNIKSLRKFYNNSQIRDLICFLYPKSEQEIVNHRTSLKLISNLNKVYSEGRSIS